MTPFRFDEGKRALDDLREFCEMTAIRTMKDQLWWYLNMEFDLVLEPDPHGEDEDGNPYIPTEDGVDIEIGYDLWVCAALVAAVCCGADDSADCMGYAEQYQQVRDAMRTELTKRKLFSKKPKYELKALCDRAAQALPYITGERCDSEVADSMGAQRDAFVSSVHALAERLSAFDSGQCSED